MALTILDVRIAYLGVEACSAPILGKAAGALGKIANVVGYEALFGDALQRANGLQLPWIVESPRANKFWKKYVTGRLKTGDEPAWPGIAREAIVPLKTSGARPTPQLHADTRRSFAEAYAWPTGIGLSWNVWIQGQLSIADLVGLIDRVRNQDVPVTAPGGTAQARRLRTLYNQTMDEVRGEAFGDAAEGTRSDPITIVSIVNAKGSGAAGEAADALTALLDGIAPIWGERPAPLAGDRHAAVGETIYAAPRLRLSWLPTAFLSDDRLHRIGCLHRNLVLSSLQIEMIAAATQMLADAKGSGALPAAFAEWRDRLIRLSDAVLQQGGYSSPFLIQQLARGPVAAARAAIQP